MADRIENFQRQAAVERHDAGIAQRNLFLLGAGIRLLADRHQFAALLHQAAIAGRIGSLEAEHGQSDTIGERSTQTLERPGRNQRRIAEHHQKIVGTAGNRRAGGQHGMRRSSALALDEDLRIRPRADRFVAHRLVIRADHDRERGTGSVRSRGKDMAQQRLACDRVQHFRQRRAHPRALARRQHDGQIGPAVHSISRKCLSGRVIAEPDT